MSDWNNMNLRELERGSIFGFVASCGHLFNEADVLDFGCGKQPYRSIVERSGGRYEPYDRKSFPGNISEEDFGSPWNVPWDVVLCTQVLQYAAYPASFITVIWKLLRPGGHLVMTTGLTWPEVEPVDLVRYTAAGLRSLLALDWTVERLESRAELPFDGFKLSLGYGVVAKKVMPQ